MRAFVVESHKIVFRANIPITYTNVSITLTHIEYKNIILFNSYMYGCLWTSEQISNMTWAY